MGFEIQNIFDVIKARNTNVLIRPLVESKVGFPHSSVGKELACNAGDLGSIPGQEDPLVKEMATHSSVLAWRIPWMAEPGGLPLWGCTASNTTEAT